MAPHTAAMISSNLISVCLAYGIAIAVLKVHELLQEQLIDCAKPARFLNSLMRKGALRIQYLVSSILRG